jgi:hypothetical protein
MNSKAKELFRDYWNSWVNGNPVPSQLVDELAKSLKPGTRAWTDAMTLLAEISITEDRCAAAVDALRAIVQRSRFEREATLISLAVATLDAAKQEARTALNQVVPKTLDPVDRGAYWMALIELEWSEPDRAALVDVISKIPPEDRDDVEPYITHASMHFNLPEESTACKSREASHG